MLLTVAACADQTAKNSPPSVADDWRRVLAAKKAAVHAADTDLEARQRYADALLAFIRKHPEHARAREVYDDLQLSFARELAARGEYQSALRYYDDLLSRRNATDIAAERAEVRSRQSVEPEEIEKLQRGMTTAEVEKLIGRPPKGWQREAQKDRTRYESWFYRTSSGDVVAIHFDNGRLFAVDGGQVRNAVASGKLQVASSK